MLRPPARCTSTSAIRRIGRPMVSDDRIATPNITTMTRMPAIRLIHAAREISFTFRSARCIGALIGADRDQTHRVAGLGALRFGTLQKQIGLMLDGARLRLDDRPVSRRKLQQFVDRRLRSPDRRIMLRDSSSNRTGRAKRIENAVHLRAVAPHEAAPGHRAGSHELGVGLLEIVFQGVTIGGGRDGGAVDQRIELFGPGLVVRELLVAKLDDFGLQAGDLLRGGDVVVERVLGPRQKLLVLVLASRSRSRRRRPSWRRGPGSCRCCRTELTSDDVLASRRSRSMEMSSFSLILASSAAC